MKQKTVWNGIYRGISYEIVRWHNSENEPIWNYYIYLQLYKLPQEYRKKSWPKPKPLSKWSFYCETPKWLYNLDFHHGCTWFSKEFWNSQNKDMRVIQVGCDYNHLWDEGQTYNERYLQNDVIDTIDSLHNLVINYGGLRRGTRSGYYEIED